VLQKFERYAFVVKLHLEENRVLGTTSEHPFLKEGAGWVPCGELLPGDRIWTKECRWVRVEELFETQEVKRVINLRVEDFATFFVGGEEWGFSVWAHNMCEFDVNRYGNFRKAPGDKLAGHEMLQNAWLRAKGLATGRSGSLVAGNPAMALGDAIHSAVGTQQSLLGLFNGPAAMNGMSALKNIALNAKAMFRTGQIPRESIVDQLRQAIAYGKSIGVI
jgi:hypothetical protein